MVPALQPPAGATEQGGSVENKDLVFALAAMIADEIGDRLHNDDDQVGQVRDWRQTSDDTAEFWFTDGRRAVVTVAVDGGA
jgi:hypothetical protein